MLFEDLKLSAPLMKALGEAGYATPTPIQSQAIPLVLSGRDILGCAQTGTGKTAAFALPPYKVAADVDASTGDIEYEGNVMVPGTVRTGFTIRAKGDICLLYTSTYHCI